MHPSSRQRLDQVLLRPLYWRAYLIASLINVTGGVNLAAWQANSSCVAFHNHLVVRQLSCTAKNFELG
jgi:hypothetical protein